MELAGQLSVILAFMGSISSMATESNKGKESWDGQIALSASSATGNTENTVLGLAFDARRIHGRYTHDIKAGVDYVETTKRLDDGTSETERTSDRWFTQYRGEVHTGDRTFVYGRLRYEEDEFSGFESRVFAGVGVGHTQIEREDMKWSLSAGPGYQYSELTPANDEAAEESESEFAFYAGSDYEWMIREGVTVEHEADATWAETNTTLKSVLALKTKLTESIATRLNYRVKHETDPPEDRENTDTLLSVSVVYGF